MNEKNSLAFKNNTLYLPVFKSRTTYRKTKQFTIYLLINTDKK